MNSSERRLKLMLLLQQPGKRLTVDELAERFDVSRRTIFRDFNALQEINVPVTWDRYSGYGLIEGYKVPPLMFTSKELATIMVGLNFVKSQVDQGLVEDAKGVEVKIKNVLPDELKEFMTSLEGRTIVDPYLRFGGEKKKGGSWYLISSAIAQQKRLQFEYTTKSGDSGIRKIDPYILVFYQDHWNVIGKSHLRGEIRNFILEKVEEVKILDENYHLNNDLDIEGLIFRSEKSSQSIILQVKKEEMSRLEANLPAKIIKKTQVNSEFIKVSFKFDNLDFINEWLLQFGKKVKIEEPKELIEKRKKLLREMLDN
ncbi:helix-turn-helix transcriptional regulator [Gracilimonas sediminicola]|uniref:YafY family transcriptional regulator n=1 Tax=Gracilimonas sediminicola TaxID=2952158 RepID=A0A9X2RGX4_9BACT|nr:YafY family protein [Gracilimonas sediminicola]MCP9291284.1 YafY family transcriptional regulator [Gracilimonas sediminicola]